MPPIKVVFYRDFDGSAPVLDWLTALRRRNRRAFARCVERVQRLGEFGHELRRPHADCLRDGIYELRARDGNVNYRLLYFFGGQGVAVVAHALTKEDKVPARDIDKAVARKAAFERDPDMHEYEE